MTGSPAIFLPRISGSAMFWSSNAWLPISSDRRHRLALGVGQLDPDHAAARDGRDARRQRRHVAGDVVGELDHAARLDPARRLQLVHRHHRAGADLDDVAADVEILEHGFEQPRVALEPGAVDLLAGRSPAARASRSSVGKCVTVAERQARLARAGLRAWPRARRAAIGARRLGHGDRRAATAAARRRPVARRRSRSCAARRGVRAARGGTGRPASAFSSARRPSAR